MAQVLKLAVWNANGLCQHVQEVKTFLQIHNIDIMLISETHFTEKSFIKIPRYNIYNTNHPDGKAHGGTALIVKNNVKHYETDKYVTEHLQATSIVVDISTGPLTISAIYCPPKHNNQQQHFEDFFLTLGNRFIAGGVYNAYVHSQTDTVYENGPVFHVPTRSSTQSHTHTHHTHLSLIHI